MPADETPSDRDYIENRIPNPGAGSHRRRRKPVFTVLPEGVTAEEAAKLLKEFAQKHKREGPPADSDANEGTG
jgi:hypothetical protein